MNKYETLKENLANLGTGKMKCFGSSMKPIIESGAMITFNKQEEYEIGDIVFCKVKGRYIDAHKITKKDQGRFMISNNHGFDNGWTKTIYGRAVQADYATKSIKL